MTDEVLIPLFYESHPLSDPEVIEIHTSDRINFKRCRRKWDYQSGTRQNLIAVGAPAMPLWFGSGWHFSMEDYWGYRRFEDPREALAAYYDAFRAGELPPDADTMLETGFGMLKYYTDYWLPIHQEEFETLWVDGKPQVEVDVHIPITKRLYTIANRDQRRWLSAVLRDRDVVYALTFDRVVIDSDGRIYGLDYKTARQIDTQKLSNDPQIGAYDWALGEFYEDQAEGMIWQQHRKAVPGKPTKLVAGGFSQNKQQDTTYPIYREALILEYHKVPPRYQEFLDYLAGLQTLEGDKFIHRSVQRRNKFQRKTEEAKILMEVLDMLDPDLPLYPNPTRDCSWDCPFKDPCLAMDDGSDVSYLLETAYVKWRGYKDDWRSRIEWPETQQEVKA